MINLLGNWGASNRQDNALAPGVRPFARPKISCLRSVVSDIDAITLGAAIELAPREAEGLRRLVRALVVAELLKHLDPLDPRNSLRFWRSKAGAEVDFVVESDAGEETVKHCRTRWIGPEDLSAAIF